MFFYITELIEYNIPDLKSQIFCDMIIIKEDEKNQLLVEKLQIGGLHRYVKYHKWIRDYNTISKPQVLSEVVVVDGCESGFCSVLKEYFDNNIDDKTIFSIISHDKGELIGGLVIMIKGDAQTEKFVFKYSDIRVKRVASYIVFGTVRIKILMLNTLHG